MIARSIYRRSGLAAALLSSLVAFEARAEFILEASGLYLSHSNTYAGTHSVSELMLGGFAGATFRKDYTIGVEYNYLSSSLSSNSVGASFSGSAFGARLGGAFGRGRWIQIGLIYLRSGLRRRETRLPAFQVRIAREPGQHPDRR